MSSMTPRQLVAARRANPYPYNKLRNMLHNAIISAQQLRLESFAVMVGDVPAITEYHNLPFILNELNDWVLGDLQNTMGHENLWFACDTGHANYILFVQAPTEGTAIRVYSPLSSRLITAKLKNNSTLGVCEIAVR